MPIVTRNEFAEQCGDDVKKLNVYINRGKVSTVPGNKKVIDTTNAINSAFMNDRRRQNLLSSVGLPAVKPPKIVTNPPKTGTKKPETGTKKPETVTKSPDQPKNTEAVKKAAEPKEIRQKIAEQSARDNKRVDQEIEKKAKDMELIELRIQREQLLLNKSAGQLLPVDLVTGIIKRHSSSIFANFERGCVNIASLFSSGDPVLYAKVLGELKIELSRCVDNAGRQAGEEVDILITDFSQTLLRGQKKV